MWTLNLYVISLTQSPWKPTMSGINYGALGTPLPKKKKTIFFHLKIKIDSFLIQNILIKISLLFISPSSSSTCSPPGLHSISVSYLKREVIEKLTKKYDKISYNKKKQKSSHWHWTRQPSRRQRAPPAGTIVREPLICTFRSLIKI